MMEAHDIQRWERTKELADACDVTCLAKDTIGLYDKKGLVLGHFNTVAEAFAFMCGYTRLFNKKEG